MALENRRTTQATDMPLLRYETRRETDLLLETNFCRTQKFGRHIHEGLFLISSRGIYRNPGMHRMLVERFHYLALYLSFELNCTLRV